MCWLKRAFFGLFCVALRDYCWVEVWFICWPTASMQPQGNLSCITLWDCCQRQSTMCILRWNPLGCIPRYLFQFSHYSFIWCKRNIKWSIIRVLSFLRGIIRGGFWCTINKSAAAAAFMLQLWNSFVRNVTFIWDLRTSGEWLETLPWTDFYFCLNNWCLTPK